MKYKNTAYRKKKGVFPLEVSCAECKTPAAIYAKGGRGNLIKMQEHRIIESESDLQGGEGQLLCHKCGEELAKKGMYKGKEAYWIVRGKINTKRLNKHKI